METEHSTSVYWSRWATALFAFIGLLLPIDSARALVLTPYFESVLVPDVSTSWTTVTLDNSYVDAIPVCTYVLETFAGAAGSYSSPPAVPRIRNIGASSFELRIQGWENSAATPGDVHCMVMDEGAHILPDGRLVEAHKVVSDQTNGQFATDGGWNLSLMEDVSGDIVQSYADPAVFGQVMSYNDSRASVIYMTDCDSRQSEPFNAGMADGICVGKHIGQIADSRSPETIGYIVAESGSGTVNNVFYELGMGADIVAGNNGANSGYSYPAARHHTMAVLSQAAEDGGNGSWAVLYGSTPLTSGAIGLVVDEEVFTGDTSRNHTREPIYYWAFAGAELTLVKDLINDDGGTAVLSDFTLSATGPSPISGTSGTAAVTTAVVQPGDYVLSETLVAGYDASSWSCVGASGLSGSTVTLASGDHAVCTISNDDEAATTLTLVKNLTNDAGGTAVVGDFTLEFTGPTQSGAGVTGDASVTSANVVSGLYMLSESAVAGYELTSISCDGTDPDGSDGVQIQAGEDVTCTFNNDDQGVDLTIVKSVDDLSPNVGQTITFSLLVTNTGPDVATDLQVIDPLPAGFSYVPLSMTGADVRDDSSPSGTGLDWSINSLAPGASTTLSFRAVVLAP